MSILLTPVLELEPWDYGNSQREYILSDSIFSKQQYWKNCLQDSGIIGLETYKPGYWFVKLKDINFNNLEIIINKHSEEQDRELLEDLDILPLTGGYIFEWEAAANCQNIKETNTLWNGHPSLLYRSKDDLIEITQTAEYGKPPEPEIFDIARKDLIEAVNKAKEELTQFTITILPITKKILPNQYKKLANQLVWGESDYQKLD